MRTSPLAVFDQLSVPMQSLVLVGLTAPFFAVFALAGDLSRGALAWVFSGALLISANALREKASLKDLSLPALVLLVLHLPLLAWNPLQHARVFGGIVQPIALIDGCVDYAVLWLTTRIFKHGPGE
jgi:hypothetical protein